MQLNEANFNLYLSILKVSKENEIDLKFDTTTEKITTQILDKICDSNQKNSQLAEEAFKTTVMTGGFFDYNLVAAFVFSDKSYITARMRDS